MTTRLNALTQAAGIALLLMLLPGTAVAQEQTAPTATQQPEKIAEEPAPVQPTPSEAAPSPASPASEENSVYVIKPGDTLWDLANTFLKDPFLWPFIWQANPTIANPDLILVGNKLSIPSIAPIERSITRAAAAPKEQEVEKQAPAVAQPSPAEEIATPEPKTREGITGAAVTLPKSAKPDQTTEEALVEQGGLVMPEEKPLPIIDKYAMLSAGFVNAEESGDRIVGPEATGKTTLSYDDVVYVDIQDREHISVGDKFLIFAPLNKVKHPKTGKQFGRLVRGLGILQIISKNSPDVLPTARITLSFDTISRNDRLMPYQEPTLIYSSAQKKAKDISGYVLEVADTRTINSQIDILYLDKGTEDGVEPGDRFNVYADQPDKRFPRKVIGELQVFIAKKHTATAFVRKSVQSISKGDAVDFEK